MAFAVRTRAAMGLLNLSRAPKMQPAHRVAALTHSAILCQRGAIEPQHRLFSSSATLKADVIVVVPPMAESLNEGTLSSLPKKVGEQIEADEEIASIETDKIDIAVNAPETAIIAEYFAAEGDTVVVGQDLARIVTGGDVGAVEKPEEETPSTEKATPSPEKETKAAESTDPKIEDKTLASTPPKPSTPAPATKPTTQSSLSQPAASTPQEPPRGEREEKMTRMRKTIATRLKQSQNTCASLTTMQEVDMTNLMAWRAKYRDEVAEEHGVRLGYMGAFAKATTLAAQQVPQINAAIDTDKEIITYRDYVDISIAVSAPKGLVTPVLRNTNALSIVELERDVATLAKKARDGKLTLDDLEGGNFSISNPGIFGSMFGTPLINYPQAAVFNMNGIQQRVMAVNGQAEIRPMMYISLTYDHRLIDGREAVAYLNTVKKYIEDPARMLLV